LRKLEFSLCGEWCALRAEQTVESREYSPVPKVYLLHSYPNNGQKRKKGRKIAKNCAKTVAKIKVRIGQRLFELWHYFLAT
jgi:hypothetical protein